MLLLLVMVLLTDSTQVLISATAVQERPSAAEWDRYSIERQSRGFRLGGADRFSHGFGRRRRLNDL